MLLGGDIHGSIIVVRIESLVGIVAGFLWFSFSFVMTRNALFSCVIDFLLGFQGYGRFG